MTGDTAVARTAGHEPVDEAADAAGEHLAERPRFGMAAHQAVPVILGRLVVHGAHAKVSRRGELLQLRLNCRIEDVPQVNGHFEIGTAPAEPLFGEFSLESADVAEREQMTRDVVWLVEVGLDKAHTVD